MTPSRLVQRFQRAVQTKHHHLQKRPTREEALAAREFVDLPDELWEHLDRIVTFDKLRTKYYEPWMVGVVLEELAYSKLTKVKLHLDRYSITPHFERRIKVKKDFAKLCKEKEAAGMALPRWKKRPWPKKGRDVFIICREEDAGPAETRVRKLAKDDAKLVENDLFSRALDPFSYLDKRFESWLELDNGFFFTLNESVADRMQEILVDDSLFGKVGSKDE